MGGAMRPYFSVIIVSLNARDSIARTINSVLRQTMQDYEIIVKDSCSTDGTIEAIPGNGKIRIFTEKDSGIYDAMNQAARYVNGHYVSFLNCGDEFYDESVLEKTYKVGSRQTSPCVLYGNVYFKGNDELRVPPQKIDDYFWYRTTLCHQSAFFSGEIFTRGGAYDLTYRVASDCKLMVQLYKGNVPFVPLGINVCTYEGGGFSETKEGLSANHREKKRIIVDTFTPLQRMRFFCKHVAIALKGQVIRS